MTEKYVLEAITCYQFFSSLAILEGSGVCPVLNPDPNFAMTFGSIEEAVEFAKHNLFGNWSIVKLSDARMADFWR